MVLGQGQLPFQAAEDSCVALGGHLASIHSDGDMLEIMELYNTKTPPEDLWLGLNDRAVRSQAIQIIYDRTFFSEVDCGVITGGVRLRRLLLRMDGWHAE